MNLAAHHGMCRCTARQVQQTGQLSTPAARGHTWQHSPAPPAIALSQWSPSLKDCAKVVANQHNVAEEAWSIMEVSHWLAFVLYFLPSRVTAPSPASAERSQHKRATHGKIMCPSQSETHRPEFTRRPAPFQERRTNPIRPTPRCFEPTSSTAPAPPPAYAAAFSFCGWWWWWARRGAHETLALQGTQGAHAAAAATSSFTRPFPWLACPGRTQLLATCCCFLRSIPPTPTPSTPPPRPTPPSS